MKDSKNTTERLKQLFEKDHWSDNDRNWILQYLETTDNSELRNLMEEKFREDAAVTLPDAGAERLLSLIHKKINSGNSKAGLFSLSNWKRLSIAASVLIIVAVAAVLFFNNRKESDVSLASVQQSTLKNDIAPGHDNATLILANGSVIELDSAANGTLSIEGSANVMKAEGQISYRTNGKSSDEVLYNTMSTARGNQYHLQLADGSRVWLNAASSIKFPTAFNGSERRVEITGEAYFEVAHDAGKPFKVKINTVSGDGGEVEVLGTHFNINAYDDEAVVNTTLAEGKVKVTGNGSIAVLQPSQQAIFDKASEKLKIQQANLEKELAWKTGMFEFHDDDLPAIMRQLSRWYDVDVSFAGPASDKLYNGSIRRQATLSQVFQILKLAGVSYTLEGKKVTVRSGL